MSKRKKKKPRRQRQLTRQERRRAEAARMHGDKNVLTLLALHMDRLGLIHVEFTKAELEAGGPPGMTTVVDATEERLRISLLPTHVVEGMSKQRPTEEHDGQKEADREERDGSPVRLDSPQREAQ